MAHPIHDFVSDPTYDGLVELLKIYMNRHDQDTLDAIPFFINCAEKVILRNLRMPKMQKMVKFTLKDQGNPEEGWINLPRDYLEMKYVWVTGSNAHALTRITFDQLILLDSGKDLVSDSGWLDPMSDCNTGCDFSSASDSSYWAINGTRMYIRPNNPEQEIFMTYFADIPELSPYVNDGRNILLDLAPDALAYLAIAEGFRFLMEPEKGDMFEKYGEKRLNQIKLMQEEAEYSGSNTVANSKGG